MKTIKMNEQVVFVTSETQRVAIMRSGWNMEFHCIVEDGEFASVAYSLLSVEEIRQKFGDDAADLVCGIAENYSKRNLINPDNNDEGTLN